MANNYYSDQNSSQGIDPMEARSSNENLAVLVDSEDNIDNRFDPEIEIDDMVTPIVVLFGPRASGKTMTLVRLSRYLCGQGYSICPERNHLPTYYNSEACDHFNTLMNRNDTSEILEYHEVLLVTVRDRKGRPVCQILDAPGELMFDSYTDERGFSTYMNSVLSTTNKKVWCFMVEPNDSGNLKDRAKYAAYISKIKRLSASRDRFIFLYNKIDYTPFVFGQGRIHLTEVRKDILQRYPNIFDLFRRRNLLFGYSDEFDLVPFQTGYYSYTLDGSTIFASGPDIYPQMLWNNILKRIKQ